MRLAGVASDLGRVHSDSAAIFVPIAMIVLNGRRNTRVMKHETMRCSITMIGRVAAALPCTACNHALDQHQNRVWCSASHHSMLAMRYEASLFIAADHQDETVCRVISSRAACEAQRYLGRFARRFAHAMS